MMIIPVANLSVSAVVAGAVEAAKAAATELLPAAVTRDAIVDAAWLAALLSAWLAAAADTLPTGVTAAAEAFSGPWLHAAERLLGELYARLAAAAVEKLPDAAAERLLAWLAAAAFLGGAVCALTCRTMKAPGLGGARVPRAVFRASPKRYYAAVRAARKARRGAGGTPCRMVSAGLVVAAAAYLAAKMLYSTDGV